MKKSLLLAVVAFVIVLPVALSASESPFNAADRNGDGKLDAREFEEAVIRNFEKLDRDRNGSLDIGEASAMKGKGGKRLFQAADANKDGKVDKEEFKAEAVRRFKICDKNRDGFVSVPEHRNRNASVLMSPFLTIYY